jgi:hypothetical protein
MPECDVSVYVEFTPTHFPYISRTWNGEQLVEEELTTPGDYKFLTSNITDLTEGWYIVRESVTYGSRLKTSGTVSILLMDGRHLQPIMAYTSVKTAI